MTKTIIVFILTTLCFTTYGQDKVFIDQPFVGLSSYIPKTREIDSLAQLPTKIQFITKEILKNSMTDFIDNITFARGQIVDLDGWFMNDSIPQIEYRGVIPKYDLYFELADTSIGIKKYCFGISFDQYGQVIYYGWPREEYNKRTNFVNPQLIKAEAAKYAKKKRYKTDTSIYELKYDDGLDKICWHVSFLQKSEGDQYHYFKEFKTFVIDATSLTILMELNMNSVGTD